MSAALLSLVQNAALLLALAAVYDLATSQQPLGGRPLRQVLVGLLTGGVGVAIMLAPVVVEPGLVFDSRSVLLAISGAFLGPLPTVIAMLVTAAFRWSQGGLATGVGVGVIVSSGLIGGLWGRVRRRSLDAGRLADLYALGVIVHVVMLAWMLLLPWTSAQRVFASVGAAVLLVHPAATAALGLLLSRRLRRERDAEVLVESESRHRALFENDHVPMLIVDPEDGAIVDANPAAVAFYGWPRERLRAMHVTEINTLSPAEVQTEMARAQAEARNHFEFRHRRADGSVREVEVASGPIIFGRRTLLYSIVKDVTERRLADERLRDTLDQFERAQAVAHLGSWVWHIRENRVEWSPQMFAIFGVDRAAFDGDLAGVIARAIHPDDRAAVERANRRVLEERRPTPMEYRVVRPDGSVRTVRGEAGDLVVGPDGSPERLSGVVLDVTDFRASEEALRRSVAELERTSAALLSVVEDHQRAEAALRQSEQDYRLLFDANPNPMWIYDLETLGFLEVNHAAVQHYGYSRQEFLAMTIERIRPAEEWPRLRAHLRQAPGTIQASGPWVHQRKDGSCLQVEVRSHSLTWRCRQTRLVLAHDVTEREAARRALEESEARLRRAIVESPVPILLHAEDGTVVQLSQAWCHITGYSRDELRTVSEWTRRAYGTDAPRVEAGIRTLFDLDARVTEGEFPIRTRSGELRIWEFSSSPVGRLPDGRRLVISMATDRTARRAAEDEVRRLNAELEERVRARTAELEAANAELEAFSYSVSHDLRAPLRGINGFARILEEEQAPRLDAEGRRILGVVRSEAVRMGTLIDDLLRFSRLGRQPIHRLPFDTRALVEAVVAECRARHLGTDVAVDLGDLPAASGDPALLRQVWVNLLDNAFKYTGREPSPRIAIRGTVEAGTVHYSVADNGIGFDMAHASRLFGVFQRLHPHEEFEGTGVGLALVRRIVGRHGGRTWAEAAPRHGATFHFTLPLNPAPGTEALT